MKSYNVRPYIGDRDLSIDGRKIPYPLVTAADYLMAKHPDMAESELEKFVTEQQERYLELNAIIAMKQARALLRHTEYSFCILEVSLYEHEKKVIEEYNTRYPDRPYDNEFYENYYKHLSVRHESLNNIDFSDFSFPVVVVYEKPKDFPDKYVMRVMEVGKGEPQFTNAIVLRDTLEECYGELAKCGFAAPLGRNKDDDPCIVGSWMKI